MKSRLGKLEDKFEKSGFNGNPVISTKELHELRNGLLEISEFMYDRNDSSMGSILRMEAGRVGSMIYARDRS